jgi:hypothetical protein
VVTNISKGTAHSISRKEVKVEAAVTLKQWELATRRSYEN